MYLCPLAMHVWRIQGCPRGLSYLKYGVQKGPKMGPKRGDFTLNQLSRLGFSQEIRGLSRNPGFGGPKMGHFWGHFWGHSEHPFDLKSPIFKEGRIQDWVRGGPKRGPKMGHFQLKPSLDSWFEREIPDFRGLDQNLGPQDPGFEGSDFCRSVYICALPLWPFE